MPVPSWSVDEGGSTYTSLSQRLEALVVGDGITKIEVISQADYDALATPEPTTLYVIVG